MPHGKRILIYEEHTGNIYKKECYRGSKFRILQEFLKTPTSVNSNVVASSYIKENDVTETLYLAGYSSLYRKTHHTSLQASEKRIL